MIDDDGIMMSLMIIHVDVEDNVTDDIDGVVDGNDDCDDNGFENIDFVQVVLFQGFVNNDGDCNDYLEDNDDDYNDYLDDND